MTGELCIDFESLRDLRSALLDDAQESCAVLYASSSTRSDGRVRLIVRDILYPESTDYVNQTANRAELAPSFVARVAKRALTDDLSLIFVHTHTFAAAPQFSSVDKNGESALAKFLRLRGSTRFHGSMVLSRGGLRARLLGSVDELRVISLGCKRIIEFEPGPKQREYLNIFDRQIRAFGVLGQQILGELRIGIVGLGGTGSIVAEQLAHLGVRNFTLIDPDVLEETNLNRVVGVTADDVGQPKAALSARYIQRFAESTVEAIVDNVVRDAVARRLLDADVIFCCTDSQGSRSVIQQIAYQYFIPCIDIGTTITQLNQQVTGIFGRVQLLSPGLGCLWCSQLLEADQVRRDMMNEYEREKDPYIKGAGEPAPSVISINGTAVSLAVTMFLGLTVGIPADATHLIYNGLAPSLRAVRVPSQPTCFMCSAAGALGRGDSRPLLTRQD
jgi:molybdopterin-synthase adenylyltransferase